MPPVQVLIVEDEPEVLKLFVSIVQRQSYHVLEALGGAKALEILTATRPDIALIDLAMPGTTGIEIVRHISEAPHLAQTAIVVITARPQLLKSIEPYRVDAILMKPVTVKQIIEVLQRHC